MQKLLIAALIAALIATLIVLIIVLIVAASPQTCQEPFLVAPYYDLTAPGPQGSPYALETCVPQDVHVKYSKCRSTW